MPGVAGGLQNSSSGLWVAQPLLPAPGQRGAAGRCQSSSKRHLSCPRETEMDVNTEQAPGSKGKLENLQRDP